jgi:hypothetical protein
MLYARLKQCRDAFAVLFYLRLSAGCLVVARLILRGYAMRVVDSAP